MARLRDPDGWTPLQQGDLPNLYAMGVRMTGQAVRVTAVWWRQPGTGVVTDVTSKFWDETGPTLQASGTVLAASITQAAWNRIAFDTPYDTTTDLFYRFTCEASREHAYDNAGPDVTYPYTDGIISLTTGYYVSGGGYPTENWFGMHAVAIEYQLLGPESVPFGPVVIAMVPQLGAPVPLPVSVAFGPVPIALTPSLPAPTPLPVSVPFGPIFVGLVPQALSAISAIVPGVLTTGGTTAALTTGGTTSTLTTG